MGAWSHGTDRRFLCGTETVTFRPGFRRIHPRWLLVGLLLLATGCQAGRPTRPPRHGGDQYLIRQSELESTRQSNLYDAIRQLRPFWYTRDVRNQRNPESAVSVYLDDQLVGGLSALRRLPIYTVAAVRYMSPTEAQVRYGQANGLRPAILIESARP